MIKEGANAPDFTAKVAGYTKDEVSLRELRGKRVVLIFYPKSGTGG